MAEPLIEFRDVVKSFGPLAVLDGVSFAVEKGQIATVVGKSGMGKSVILKHIVGLLRADSGEILFDGRELSGMGRRDRRELKSRVSYLFQNVALFDSMTVFDNIALPLRERTKLGAKEIRAKVHEKLEKLEVAGTAEKYPSEISGGMQKRVGLARALIMDPEIVLFDEPTTGLDPIRKNAVHSMISHMQRRFNFTAIIVSHEIPDVFFISQKILMLDDGQILVDCPPEEIGDVADPTVRDFIKGLESPKDEATGLPHKAQLEQTFARSAGSHQACSLIVFTVNELDDINERFGFIAGQKIVQHLAQFIENYLHVSGDNFRYGDSLLVTMLPNTQVGMARILLKKVGAAMAECPDLPPEGYGEEIRYTVSAGAAEAKGGCAIDQVVAPALGDMSVVGEFTLR